VLYSMWEARDNLQTRATRARAILRVSSLSSRTTMLEGIHT